MLTKLWFCFFVALAIVMGGNLALAQGRPNLFVSAQPTNPTGNATTSFTMMGLGVTGAGGGWLITPVKTGQVRFDIVGGIANSTASDGVAIAIVTDAVSHNAAPANAATVPTGSVVCTNANTLLLNNANTAALIVPFHLSCVQNLAIGQQYWADVELKAVTGGTATITSLQVFAAEEGP